MHYFEPINKLHTTEEVLYQLKNAILGGYLKKGDKLPSERELAKLFNVSRGVVREAIRGLQASGFIEIMYGPYGGGICQE
jgi:GntR family transcriptional regulator, transcriptional repressor for pyruvate dehydrogenase complex